MIMQLSKWEALTLINHPTKVGGDSFIQNADKTFLDCLMTSRDQVIKQ